MAIIKCKMCGGDIELTTEKTYGTCEYCGSTMTLPKIDDEQRAAAFNRGNHFRRIGEFDKALAVYERIVREDDTDAEAHWCCALCRFGIEYVEDPASYEYLPTCHRASFDSFLEDVDYLAAVEHSQGITKRQYQKDGAKIAEVQRGILATSQNTEPYDVFICYKESDESGGRTRDSLMAQDIYYQLTEQGRKVFFARITLEDVAGAQYEPYIFAALNSSKVMIVVGTKPEHLNAVWVKNEWSRFLAMMKKDRHKLLLPCYRDMDPYDMPEQLSVLQSYDMAKIGFIQDLTRGIAKVLDAEKKPETVKETVVVQQTAAPANNTASLLKRAFMFLEDGDWNAANEYCEKVLDIDPENARAYLGKLMAELKVKKQEELKNCAEPFDHLNSYQKTLRFSEKSIVEELKVDIDFINERNEQQRLEGLYLDAMRKMTGARTEDAYKSAALAFALIPDYCDADAKRQLCLDKAEECAMKVIYDNAVREAKKDTVYALKEAVRKLERIRNWFDANQKITDFESRIKEIEAKEEAERQEAARQSKRNKKIGLIVAAIAAVGIVIWILTANVFIPNSKYNDAVDLMEAGKYEEAISAFEAMEGYKDSNNKIGECNTGIRERNYNTALSLMEAGNYEEAIVAFEAMEGYKDSNDIILECRYRSAVSLMDEEKYEEAIDIFRSLYGYGESNTKIAECKAAIPKRDYAAAVALMEAGWYEEAIAAFENMEGYLDSDAIITEIRTIIFNDLFEEAVALMKTGSYIDAINVFEELEKTEYFQVSRYEEALQKKLECMTNLAVQFESADDIESAIRWYEAANDLDSANRVRYDYVLAHKNSEDVTTYEYLKKLKADGYKDAETIYESLYAFRARLFANRAEDDTQSVYSAIYTSSENRSIYVHYQVSGGPPVGEMHVTLYIERYDDDSGEWVHASNSPRRDLIKTDGSDNTISWYTRSNQKYRISLCDSASGKQLAQIFVYYYR